jgi:large subunit ribosomal protein L9
MKVLLIKDVYKLGRAGDVKKVADGFGRNFLLPQGLAVLATPGAIKQTERIRSQAAIQRAALNNELGGLADQINGLILYFPGKAGDTGKLYGSINSQMVADAINQKLSIQSLDRHHVELQPIRTLGEFTTRVRLTVDLTPEVKVIVYRDTEPPAELDGSKIVKISEELPATESIVEPSDEIVDSDAAKLIEELPTVDRISETPAEQSAE